VTLRIDTERMILSAATTGDIDRLVQLDTDAAVMRYINGGRPTSREDAERRLGEASVLMATDRSTSEFIGWFSSRTTAANERELGYRLRQRSWGRGLATEGALATIAVAFDDPLVDRVWAQTMTVNIASRRVMENCGLRFVRTFFHE
jgi:RimJ/RimL family protein N-acetyltransferase